MGTGQASHRQKARDCVDKAWHYLYGDGADPVTGHGFATLAIAHLLLAQQKEEDK